MESLDDQLAGSELLPVERGSDGVLTTGQDVPAIVKSAGRHAVFAFEEFFFAAIRNPLTRRAYRHAVERFLTSCDRQAVELRQITPKLVGQYLDRYPASISTKKQHLAALRHFFDELVRRHVVVLSPAASVRSERQQVLEGKTPQITVDDARKLLRSIETSHVVGLRDKAIVSVLIYTAARVGAVAKLRQQDFYNTGDQWCFRFLEKGGKSREIPARHDLQQVVRAYIAEAGFSEAGRSSPLFRSAVRREKRLSERGTTANDIGRMVKRRLADAGLSSRLSCHSFRVATITNLLVQGVPLEDVQRLAGHADPRTTRLYDRRHRQVSRNIVERIGI